MTYVIFSFDTEDPVHPEGADAIARLAKTLSDAGEVGCFNTTGGLARALIEWGRDDVIEIMKQHEIDIHSNRHSIHPTINEYTDVADYNSALEAFNKDEGECIDTLKSLFGIDSLPAACPPGDNCSYVARYGYAEMGIPIYTGDVVADDTHGRPVGFCNMNSLHYFSPSMERMFFTADEKYFRDLLDKLASRETAVIYHHPARSYYTTYWDVINFNRKNTPKDQWDFSPRRSDEEIDKFYENFALLIKLIQNDPRFEITTYREYGKKLNSVRKITADLLPGIKAQLDEDFFPVTVPDSFCISDMFLACRDLLLGKKEHECGKVYGFLDEPYAVTEPVTVTAAEMRESAKHLNEGGFLPDFIYADDKKLGPADWMRAAIEVIAGAETVTVAPGPWQIDVDKVPGLRYKYKGSWVFCDNFEDNYLSKRQMLQSWTIRLPKNTDRYFN